MGEILQSLTTSPCFKTERKAISFPERSANQHTVEPSKLVGGLPRLRKAKESEAESMSDSEECMAFCPDGLE